ncbi:MAG: DNA mismatch repair protein MutS, partial [Bdellovibrionales bacterium]|nr:DNA mismatch repair protein MutS [Bdellovibrionales bacterium]
IELAENGQKKLLEMEEREREITGISSLKIRYNKVFGYYIEITNTHKDKVPSRYLRKQTLVNAERYLTDELQELERKLLSARAQRAQMEEEYFRILRDEVLKSAPLILVLANQLSQFDVLGGLAWLAIENRYVRPEFSLNGTIELLASRHPVVEQDRSIQFVPNDIFVSKGGTLLLTGPNMAGKSTLMRQVGLIGILAQMGSFVPASKANLPIFDRIFTRIGANDSLTQGLSTFMVEMSETAELLAQATPHSLIILDEIGRGTSTYDGMSLAQAILEHLATVVKSQNLFATHYHELTALDQEISNLKNAHMEIQENKERITFLYLLKDGPADRSYGVEVAKLAGLPAGVIHRAQKLLAEKESQMPKREQDLPKDRSQLSLFSDGAAHEDPKVSAKNKLFADLAKKIADFSVDDHTPMESMITIAQWKSELGESWDS